MFDVNAHRSITCRDVVTLDHVMRVFTYCESPSSDNRDEINILLANMSRAAKKSIKLNRRPSSLSILEIKNFASCFFIMITSPNNNKNKVKALSFSQLPRGNKLSLLANTGKLPTMNTRIKHLHTSSMFLQGGSPGLGKNK